MTQKDTGILTSSDSWAYLKVLVMLMVIVLSWWLLARSELMGVIENHSWVKEQVDGFGWYGPVVFIVVSGLATVVGVPRLLISAIAGFSFNFIAAVFIALAATMVGCVISFYYARAIGRSVVRNFMTLRMGRFEKLLLTHGFLAGIAIRAIPVSNNTIVNLLAGVTSVTPSHYFLGSLIGYLPLTVVFVLVGSGIQQDVYGRILLSVVLYLFVVIPIGYFVQKNVLSTGPPLTSN